MLSAFSRPVSVLCTRSAPSGTGELGISSHKFTRTEFPPEPPMNPPLSIPRAVLTSTAAPVHSRRLQVRVPTALVDQAVWVGVKS